MKKKLLSLVLTLCMLCSSCVVLGTTAFAAASTPTADDGALTAEALTFADTQGEGTININGATDWAKFVEAAQTLDFAGVVIKLNADITYNEGMTATEITAATDTSGYTKWTSIPKFSGTFDGGEHTISGLYVLGDGFISDLMGGATVQNVTFSNCYVKDVPSTVLWNCGLVAARATGSAGQTVTLSHVTVESSSVSSDQWSASGMIGEVCYVSVNAEYCTNGANVSNTQTVNKTAHSAGIVCGGANAGPITLDHCINTGTISSVSTRNWANQSSGGLVAYAKTTVLITNSENRGEIANGSMVGGIIGSIHAGSLTLRNTGNSGKVNCSSYYAGGMIAYAYAPVTFENAWNAGQVNGAYFTGGFGGQMDMAVTVTNSVNSGTVNSNDSAGGFGGLVNSTTEKVTLENVVNSGAIQSRLGNVGGLVGNVKANDNVSVKKALNTGTLTGLASSAAVGGLLGGFVGSKAHLEECISVGTLQENLGAGGGAFIGSSLPSAASTEKYILLKNCYYLKDMFENGSGVPQENSSFAIGVTDNATNVNYIRAEYTAKNCEQMIVGTGEAATLSVIQTLNTVFTDGTTGAMLSSIEELSGLTGVAFLQKAGYDFTNDWYVTNNMPVPTKLALEKSAVDTTDVAYKGYQTKIEAGNTETFGIRLVAGLNGVDYADMGYELAFIEANVVRVLEAKKTTTVYGQLNTYTNEGTLSDPVKASDCGCTYLSAITVSDIPNTASAVSLVIKPFVTNVDGSVTYGTAIVLEIVNGAVVAQRTL